MVWTCLLFIRSDQYYLARYSEGGGEKTRQTEKEVENNMREWTGLEFVNSQRAVENRGNAGNWL